MSSRNVLIIDDESAVRRVLVAMLARNGIDSVTAADAEEGLAQARTTEFGAVLSDVQMPGLNGIELLGPLRETQPDTPVILMTGFGSIDSAVEAMRAGAFHYVTKPINRDELLLTLDRAFELRALERENRELRLSSGDSETFAGMIGRSTSLREVFATIRKVGPTRANVLVTGESGTGKELVARAHPLGEPAGERRIRPRELCGDLRGAARERAVRTRARRVHRRRPVTSRAVLRGRRRHALPRRDRRDGHKPCRPSSCARSRMARCGPSAEAADAPDQRARRRRDEPRTSPSAWCDAGSFRQDLYYRLNVVTIDLPPLRERLEDVPLLAETFLARFDPRGVMRFAPDALERLMRHPWPGNVRELENAVEHAAALAEGERIEAVDLPLEDKSKASVAPLDFLDAAVEGELSLRQLEDLYIERMLAETGGNKVQAAGRLGHQPAHALPKARPLATLAKRQTARVGGDISPERPARDAFTGHVCVGTWIAFLMLARGGVFETRARADSRSALGRAEALGRSCGTPIRICGGSRPSLREPGGLRDRPLRLDGLARSDRVARRRRGARRRGCVLALGPGRAQGARASGALGTDRGAGP